MKWIIKITKVLLAIILTVPCLFPDFMKVFTESYTGESINDLYVPKLWIWAIT